MGYAMRMTDEQNEIVNYSGEKNIILTACAGSGKTAVIVERIKKLNLKSKSHKKRLLLTTTNAVRDELIERLSDKNVVVETFHSFILKEVMPFVGLNDISVDTSIRLNEYEEWKEELIVKKLICGSSKTRDDFWLEYGVELLEEKYFILEYIKAKFEEVYVDEAQDNNEFKAKIIETFISLNIKVCIVGDVNQSIFGFTGARPDVFESYFTRDDFQKFELSRNFRCDERINMFANSRSFENIHLYAPNVRQITADEIHNLMQSYSSLTVICRINKQVDFFVEQYGFLKVIKPQFKNDRYSNIINTVLKYYWNIISTFQFLEFIDYSNDNIVLQGIDELNGNPISEELMKTMRVEAEDIDDLIDEINSLALNQDVERFYRGDVLYQAMNIHTSKGLEFENVLVFEANYNQLQSEEDNHLFYVSCTRAKEKLLVFTS